VFVDVLIFSQRETKQRNEQKNLPDFIFN